MRRTGLFALAVVIGLTCAVACTGTSGRPPRIDSGARTPDAGPQPPRGPGVVTVGGRTGCPAVLRSRYSSIVDYADFLRWNGRFYIGSTRRHVPIAHLKRRVGTVNCTIVKIRLGMHHVLGPIRNGNALTLPVGTEIFTSRPRPRCELITRNRGRLEVWSDLGCPKTH